MHVYRIQKAKYAADISGVGSTLVAGRWHLAGKSPILYTSANVSLAILEYVVHLTSAVKPPELLLLTLEIPEVEVVTIPDADLPDNWNKKGYYDNVQRWGTDWLQSLTSLAIAVPSVTSPDNNILINPSHPDFGSVKITDRRPITLDDRLI
jgi:RES domain-containing protein